MSSFPFVPRKLLKKAPASTISTETPNVSQNRAALGAQPLPSSCGKVVEKSSTEGDKHTNERDNSDVKGKGKLIAKTAKKLLNDEEYGDLLRLALSDHAIWSDRELYEELDGREGFVGLKDIIQQSPLFAALPSVPPESVLARAANLHAFFEVRMIVTDPWATGSSHGIVRERGGFEIRRTDWLNVKARIRKYTSFYWDDRTVYMENIPVESRSKPAIARLVRDLLRGASGEQVPGVEHIHFPPHRDDDPETPEPFKCKGFAFVTLSSSKDVNSLLETWNWERQERAQMGDKMKTAVDSGLRTLSKRKWNKLKEEYLLYQQQLLTEAARQNAPPPRPRRNLTQHDALDSIAHPNSQPEPLKHDAEYPVGCLVIVNNIRTDTNKTTLKNLFSSSFEGSGNHIDYVDYTKGLDTCYLRLSDSKTARLLVTHINKERILQSDGLDGDGTRNAKTNFVTMELIQGRREEIYWEKVPLKIRQQAARKANALDFTKDDNSTERLKKDGESERSRKRRKHN